jgi:hypothetical protein
MISVAGMCSLPKEVLEFLEYYPLLGPRESRGPALKSLSEVEALKRILRILR